MMDRIMRRIDELTSLFRDLQGRYYDFSDKMTEKVATLTRENSALKKEVSTLDDNLECLAERFNSLYDRVFADSGISSVPSSLMMMSEVMFAFAREGDTLTIKNNMIRTNTGRIWFDQGR
ncbi:hypothetical protein VTN77DRAFT_589 [Rasamsonia byssochlamydoides]|uniref:uncharacterized protein n=1 Tax=Rasamsonia byssochlamydoides TaxID=89139 RepID=UPI00374268E1